MSNFKGWTSEANEAREQRQLAKRLDAQMALKANRLVAEKAASKFNDAVDLSKSKDVILQSCKPKRKKNPEYNIQKDFVQEMGRRYPGVLVFSDAAAHVAKSMIQQVRANALQSKGQKWPDVIIFQPSGDYAGLLLECKAETPYKADGVTLKKNDHVEAQAATMQRLRERGYYCDFFWSVEQGMEIVEKYLNL